MQAAAMEPVSAGLQQRPIVCGVARTARGLATARAAGTIARAAGAPLILVHVTRKGEPADRVSTAVRRQLTLADINVQTRAGRPAASLRTVGRETNAALIVIGFGGQGVLRATITGSVADEVVPTSPCPVMVVPRQEAETGTT